MSDQATTSIPSTELVKAAVGDLIRHDGLEQFSGLGPTDIRNLSDRITSAVMRYDGEFEQVEAALTIATTIGSLKKASVGAILRQLDAGLLPIQAHNLLLFAEELEIPVEFAKSWLRRFDVRLTDTDDAENAVISTRDAINGYHKKANSEQQRAEDKNADSMALMEGLIEIAEERVITSLENLVEVFV